jgi:hypothetical protein
MCNTQRELVKTFTQDSLDKCSSVIKLNFDHMKQQILNELMDGVRLDIFEKLNGVDNHEYKIYTSDDIKKEFLQLSPPLGECEHNFYTKNGKTLCEKALEVLFDSKKLNKNEHYVYFTGHYSWGRNTEYSSQYYNIIISMGLVTNFSNIIWLEVNDKSVGRYMTPTQYNTETTHIPYKTYNLNIPLHDIFINILHAIKSLPSQINPIISTQRGGDSSQYKEYRNIHRTEQNTNHRDVYETIVKILNLNKKYSIHLLVESDLQKKYDALVKKNEQLQKITESLETKIEKLESQLKESISEQYRCCVCFGYTDKKKACVPCGHAQYCDNCICDIKKCAICRKDVTTYIPLFM